MEQSPEAAKIAGDLLKQIVKVRTTANEERVVQKKYFLEAGRAIDGAFNILKAALTPKEEALKAIKLFDERQKEARIEAIKEARIEELAKYGYEGIVGGLGSMEEDLWSNFRDGVKSKYEAVKLAEKQTEDQQIEKERREAVQDARLKKLFEIGLVFNGDSLVYKDINFHHTDVLCMTDEEFDKACTGAIARKEVLDKQEAEEVEVVNIYEKRRREMSPYSQFGVSDLLSINMSLEDFVELKVEMRKRKSDYDIEQKRIYDENEKLRLDKVKSDKEAEDREAEDEEQRKLDAAALAAPEKIRLMKIAKYIYDQRHEFKNEKILLAMKEAVYILKQAAEEA